ncbi:hypothetical protein [Mycobacterium sp. C31M]
MFISPDQDPKERVATLWERIEAQTGVDEALQSRAAVELECRLQHWHGDYLPRPSRFKNKQGIDLGTHLVVPVDPIELVIVRAISMTRGAAQFGVSPNGAIFTAEGDGWTIHGPRVDITRVSWLLDEAADILQTIRRGKGGRFYERNGLFFLADRKTTILEAVDEPDPAKARAIQYDKRPLWQKAISTVFRKHWDQPPQRSNGPQLPDEIGQARSAPLRRQIRPVETQLYHRADRGASRHTHGSARKEQICPVHFVILPDHGVCDDCRTD